MIEENFGESFEYLRNYSNSYDLNDKFVENILEPKIKRIKSDKRNSINTISTKATNNSNNTTCDKKNKYDINGKNKKSENKRINKFSIPRPILDDEIYKNSDKRSIFQTDAAPTESIPLANSNFSVKETENSSIRIIRPSMHYIPTEAEIIKSSDLELGLFIQPFALLKNDEKSFDVIEVKTIQNIPKCKKCNCFYNRNFIQREDFIINKKYFQCNLCQYESELDADFLLYKESEKNILFISPTIDYKLVEPQLEYDNFRRGGFINDDFSNSYTNIKSNDCKEEHVYNEFYINHVFLIDISINSYDLGFYEYITSSISYNLSQVFNNYLQDYSTKKKIIPTFAFITYDSTSVQFYYIDSKTNEVKVNIMSSLNDPFCPVTREKIFMKLSDNSQTLVFNQIEKIMEKIQLYAEFKNKKIKELNSYEKSSSNSQDINQGSAIISAIYSAYDLVKNFNTKFCASKFFLFSSNKSRKGILSIPEMDFNEFYSTDSEIKLFLPQHTLIVNLSKSFIEKGITLNIFVLGDNSNYKEKLKQVHLPTFAGLSNNTGGNIFYYNLNYVNNNVNELKSKYEKLHFDLNYILSTNFFTNVKFYLNSSTNLEAKAIFGPFDQKNNISTSNKTFSFSEINTDFNITYSINLRKNTKLSHNQKVHFQFVIYYTNPTDGFNYVRMINCSLTATEDLKRVFAYLNVDCMTKLILMKELSSCLDLSNKNVCSFEKIKGNLINRLVNILSFYKMDVSLEEKLDNLTLPFAIRYMPLYFDSFIKKPLMRKIKNKIHPNIIAYFINSIFSLPLNRLIKMLYPRMYGIDHIKKNLKKVKGKKEYMIVNDGLKRQDEEILAEPILCPLMIDSWECDKVFLYDDGFYISLIISHKVNKSFLKEVFKSDDFENLLNNSMNINLNHIFNSNGEILNNSRYKSRIANIIEKIRDDNNQHYQALNLFLVNENYLNEEKFTSLFIEDEYKEELSYVDFLFNIHISILALIDSELLE